MRIVLMSFAVFYRFFLHTEKSNAKQFALVDQTQISAYDKATITCYAPDHKRVES